MEARTEELIIDFGKTFATMVVRVFEPAMPPKGAVFCFHGFTGNGSDFEFLAVFLARSGYRVVCPDMIGRGRSSYLGEGAGYNLNNYLKCMQALLKFRVGETYFIGTSWGGILILLFLYLTRLPAKKVVLNDIPMRGGADADAIRNDIVGDSERLFPDLATAQDYVKTTRAFMGAIPPESLDRYLENKVRKVEGGYRMAYDPATTASFAEFNGREYDLFQVLSRLKGSFLLVYGKDSKFADRPTIAALRKERPNIWLVDDLDAGHPPSLMTLPQALLVLGYLDAV